MDGVSAATAAGGCDGPSLQRQRHAAIGTGSGFRASGAADEAAGPADLPRQDHGQARHRREAPAAGRPHQDQDEGQFPPVSFPFEGTQLTVQYSELTRTMLRTVVSTLTDALRR